MRSLPDPGVRSLPDLVVPNLVVPDLVVPELLLRRMPASGSRGQ